MARIISVRLDPSNRNITRDCTQWLFASFAQNRSATRGDGLENGGSMSGQRPRALYRHWAAVSRSRVKVIGGHGRYRRSCQEKMALLKRERCLSSGNLLLEPPRGASHASLLTRWARVRVGSNLWGRTGPSWVGGGGDEYPARRLARWPAEEIPGKPRQCKHHLHKYDIMQADATCQTLK